MWLLIVKDWIGTWFFARTCAGYLLQLHRIVVAGLVVLLGCAVLYQVGASPETITHNGLLADGLLSNGQTAIEAWDAVTALGVPIAGLYFSLTTFVTLGYGDFAPLGWFKLVSGLQALSGVTLLALFTVAWGRKLVR